MIEVQVPGFGALVLEHLVLDFNGTLACDGELLPGVAERLAALAPKLSIHVLTGLTAGPDGAIYLAEMGFWPYPAGGGQVTRLTVDGQAGPAATGITAAIAVAFGPDGTLYALEHSSPLKQAHNTGRLVRTRPDGPPEPLLEGLNLPTALTTGPDGSLYFVDAGARVRRIGPDGVITTMAGDGNSGADDIPAAQSGLGAPRGLAVGPDGSVYVSELTTHKVRRITPDGMIRRVAGTGTRLAVSEHNPLSVRVAKETQRRMRTLPASVGHFYRQADAIGAVSQGVADDLATTARLAACCSSLFLRMACSSLVLMNASVASSAPRGA